MNQKIHPICQATEKSTSPSRKISLKVVPVVKALPRSSQIQNAIKQCPRYNKISIFGNNSQEFWSLPFKLSNRVNLAFWGTSFAQTSKNICKSIRNDQKILCKPCICLFTRHVGLHTGIQLKGHTFFLGWEQCVLFNSSHLKPPWNSGIFPLKKLPHGLSSPSTQEAPG